MRHGLGGGRGPTCAPLIWGRIAPGCLTTRVPRRAPQGGHVHREAGSPPLARCTLASHSRDPREGARRGAFAWRVPKGVHWAHLGPRVRQAPGSRSDRHPRVHVVLGSAFSADPWQDSASRVRVIPLPPSGGEAGRAPGPGQGRAVQRSERPFPLGCGLSGAGPVVRWWAAAEGHPLGSFPGLGGSGAGGVCGELLPALAGRGQSRPGVLGTEGEAARLLDDLELEAGDQAAQGAALGFGCSAAVIGAIPAGPPCRGGGVRLSAAPGAHGWVLGGCCSGSKTLLGPFVGLTRGILPAWGPVNPYRPRALERSGPPGSPRGRAPLPGCRPCSPASRPGDGARRGHVRSRGRASEGSGYTRRGSGGAGRGNPRGCWAASSRCPGAPASPRTLSAALEVRGPRPRAPRVLACCAAGGNRAADRSQRPGRDSAS